MSDNVNDNRQRRADEPVLTPSTPPLEFHSESELDAELARYRTGGHSCKRRGEWSGGNANTSVSEKKKKNNQQFYI